jgi:hypothetical protein
MTRVMLGAVILGFLSLGCSEKASMVLPGSHTGDRLGETPPAEILAAERCQTPSPGSSPLRRLSNREYRNTLVDLGFDEDTVTRLVSVLPNEPESLGFRNAASALSVNTLLAQAYMEIAEELSLLRDPECSLEGADCASRFIEDLGLLMHRRPLTDEQRADYLALYQKAQDLEGSEAASRWVVTAMLQSPHFLYRVEIPEAQVSPVTGHEMAARLSYTFWQAPPDQVLRDAAAAGQLETKEQVLAQALRLLQDPRAFRVYEFFEQWLDLDELDTVERDPALYPNLNPQLAELLRAESRAFIQDLLTDPSSSFQDLLGAKHTFVNQALARHYGLPDVVGDTFVRVDAEERSGVLTQGMLAAKDASAHTSIVRRGLKIRTDFLCQLVPAPPNNVDLTLDGIGADLTQAERLEVHRRTPTCATCHSLMDPIGIAFESFDAVGRHRLQDEYGNELTTAGEISGTLDADGPVSSVSEMATALSDSLEAQQCYMVQNFRFFFGRDATGADLCSQAQLAQVFEDSDQSLLALLVGIAQTDAFLFKAGLEGRAE